MSKLQHRLHIKQPSLRSLPKPARARQGKASIAIIAGEGALAHLITRACLARGEVPLIIMLPHKRQASVKSFFGCQVLFPKTPWAALRLAHANSIRRVIFAGKYTRSTAKHEAERTSKNILLAFITKRLIARFGDDRAMRRIAWILKLFAIRVVAPQEFYPALTPQRHGLLGTVNVSSSDKCDIQLAKRVLDLLAPLDIGQGIVVSSGLVLGIETLEGTDALLQSVARLKKQRSISGGVLVKLPKIGQRRDLDLPAIGVKTVRMVTKAGLRGIAIECQGALLIPPDATIAAANKHSIFICGIAASSK